MINLNNIRLKGLGILWCSGSILDKSKEFYNNIALLGEPKVSCNDKDFKPNLFALFDIASEVVFKIEPKYTKKKAYDIT